VTRVSYSIRIALRLQKALQIVVSNLYATCGIYYLYTVVLSTIAEISAYSSSVIAVLIFLSVFAAIVMMFIPEAAYTLTYWTQRFLDSEI
jgi:biotin transporter BioY